jgi:hypothetical protein
MTELPDRLLRDTLRDEASTTPSPTCVDARALAAWADDTMTRTERAIVERHAVGCARCLALLAAMARTAPPPIAPPWWRRSPNAWLLPLAAATAGLVIVVRLAVLEQRAPVGLPTAAPAVSAPPQLNVPQVTPPPAPTQPPATSLASKAPAVMRRPKPEAVPAEAGTATRAEAAAKATAAPKSAAAPPPAAAMPPAPGAPAQVPASAPAAAVQAPASAQAAQTPEADGRVAGGRGGAGGGRALAARDAMKTTAQGFAPAPIVIPSPDPDLRWRIVGGTVEHTTDGGATWQPQSIAVATPMRAGAAPGARVCWVVGVGGAVLRTTDGTTWARIPFPEPADLVAIQASDASHATVTMADGRRFATADGGATWVRQ